MAEVIPFHPNYGGLFWHRGPHGSHVHSLAYSKPERKLFVRFRGKERPEEGPIYAYAEVSRETYRDLLKASSLTQHVNLVIGKTHQFRRIWPAGQNTPDVAVLAALGYSIAQLAQTQEVS